MKIGRLLLFWLMLSNSILSQNSYQLAVLKYKGGGDWYANPSSLKNLAIFCNKYLNMNIDESYNVIEPNSQDLFDYPFIYMTGHGNVLFTNSDVENIRKYLLGGGFLHIDDNYGMDKSFRRELSRLFPNKDLVILPNDHAIFSSFYLLKRGLPKIHEHDNMPPQALGLFEKNRLILLYTYESDLGDGWETDEEHLRITGTKLDYNKKLNALKMGTNIIIYALTH